MLTSKLIRLVWEAADAWSKHWHLNKRSSRHSFWQFSFSWKVRTQKILQSKGWFSHSLDVTVRGHVSLQWYIQLQSNQESHEARSCGCSCCLSAEPYSLCNTWRSISSLACQPYGGQSWIVSPQLQKNLSNQLNLRVHRQEKQWHQKREMFYWHKQLRNQMRRRFHCHKQVARRKHSRICLQH